MDTSNGIEVGGFGDFEFQLVVFQQLDEQLLL